MNAIYDFDFAVLEALQKIHCTFLNYFLMCMTYLCEGGAVWILFILLFMRKKHTRAMGMAAANGLILMILSNTLIKRIVQRPRPFILHPWIDTFISHPGDYSFPSGHSCSSFAAATAVFCYNKSLGIAAYITAAVIAFSRVYFAVHFVTDVICGSIFGVILGLIAVKITGKVIVPRFGKKLGIAPEQSDQS